MAVASAAGPARPRLRGVLHEAGFYVAVPGGVAMAAVLDGKRLVAAAVFAATAALMLGASALYHRVTWSPRARLRMRRVDDLGIHALIAGTYTPIGLLCLHGVLQKTVLAVAWAGAGAALVLKLTWARAPGWIAVALAIAVGWVGVIALPQIAASAGVGAVVLLAAGGVAYTVGAVIYARRRPDPFPRVFGYHELFHACTLVALACQYAAIAVFVVRA